MFHKCWDIVSKNWFISPCRLQSANGQKTLLIFQSAFIIQWYHEGAYISFYFTHNKSISEYYYNLFLGISNEIPIKK